MNLLLYSWGGAITDGIALAIIVFITIRGAKQGFIKSLLSTFGTLLSFLFAVLLCTTVTGFLETKYAFVSNVSEWIQGIMIDLFGASVVQTPISSVDEGFLTQNGIGHWLVSIIVSFSGKTDYVGKTVGNIISPVFAYYIVCAISLLGLFIVFKIIFFIIGDLSKKLKNIVVVGNLNTALGCLFGFIKSVIVIDLIIILVGAIPLGFFQSIMYQINSSFIAALFSKVNFLGLIFDSLSGKAVVDFISSLSFN